MCLIVSLLFIYLFIIIYFFMVISKLYLFLAISLIIRREFSFPLSPLFLNPFFLLLIGQRSFLRNRAWWVSWARRQNGRKRVLPAGNNCVHFCFCKNSFLNSVGCDAFFSYLCSLFIYIFPVHLVHHRILTQNV